jgi:REP element-mobilizing transposase RayT
MSDVPSTPGDEVPQERENPLPFLDPSAPIDTHWHNLPHWQQDHVFYFCTWRLGDALPISKLGEWQEEKAAWIDAHPQPWDERVESEFHERFTRRMDEWLDAGHGSCILRAPIAAQVVADAFHYLDGSRYHLDCFVVMPNHVHGLFRLKNGIELPVVMHSLKSFTAKQINSILGRSGAFWQEDYWDRIVRNERHLWATRKYIAANARVAGGLLWQSAEAKKSLLEAE